MEFYRTMQSVEALKRSEEVTIYEALKIFYCLCQDIREESGQTIDRQPIGDDDEAARKLCWAGNTLLMLFQNNRDHIMNPERDRMFREIEGKLTKSQEEWEEAAKQAEQLETGKQELKKRIEVCRKLEEEKKKLENAAQQIKEKSEELEQAIKAISLEELQEQWRTHQEALADLTEKRKRLEEAIGRMKRQTGQEIGQISQLEKEWEELEEERKRRSKKKEETERKIDQSKAEMNRLEQWFKGLEAGEREQELERCKERLQTLRKARKTLVEDLEQLNVFTGHDGAERSVECRRYFEEKMSAIEASVTEYEEHYRMVIRMAEEGGRAG